MEERALQIELTQRAEHLLRVLVEQYIREGLPVGSRTLARASGLDLSPATVRNVMADLEEMGLVRSPHTSAGRVPTVLGYRLFVDRMIEVRPLDEALMEEFRDVLGPGQGPHELVERASTLLSRVTQLAGLVTVPRAEHAVLRRIEFLELSGGKVLVVLVLEPHEVQNLIIELERPYSREALERAAAFLNERFSGMDLQAVRARIVEDLDCMRRDMDRLACTAAELGDKVFAETLRDPEDFVMMGQTHLMRYAELSDVEKLRQLFEAFTEKREILELLDKCIEAEGVQIFIGQESGYDALAGCSVVSAPYRVGGDIVGVLGVIGPTRMHYERVIPVVDATARLLGEALSA
ncbi:MAG TPA: heat-inducible transcription repressor HrcA [Chromatiales bacterium]|nr:heat-inducible transcription repressor HrcA [Chromatiales bacterium]